MVASILFDIQQYQNQPYNLIPVPEIQEFLTGLSPLKGFTEKQFNDYLFACSQEIEPRHAERAARFVSYHVNCKKYIRLNVIVTISVDFIYQFASYCILQDLFLYTIQNQLLLL